MPLGYFKESSPGATQAPKVREGSSPLLILIADDDLAVRDSLCALLESAGYDTLVASSGKEAIAQLERRPDLVLTDINMPDATGLEVIKAIRSTGRSVPVIAMSGWQPLGYSPLGLAQKLGADKVMDKGDMSDLLPALEQLLAGRRR
jgi:CheY-like chemotaxis protein